MDHMNDEGFITPFPPKSAAAGNEAPTTRLVPTERGIAVAWTSFGIVLGFAASIIIVVVTTW
jgi:hypothetical protein